MKPELRLLAAIAALILPIARGAGTGTSVPMIQLAEPQFVSGDETSCVTFTIPKYVLTPNERKIVATCLVLEAANQGDFGMRGVMAVIRNRARGRPELFAATVLREKQFSALNTLTAGRETFSRTIGRASADRMWQTALTIVDEALDESWRDPTGGATHYTRTGERYRWTSRLTRTVIIGAHSFYR